MKANQLKVKFIEWLIRNNNTDIVIGNEVLFSENECRADIVMLKNNKIYAYEIKSDSDNFLDFDKQISNYLTTFNYTYLIITSKHAKQIEKISHYNIGIYIYIDNQFTLIQKPILSKQISKHNLLTFLKKTELLSLINKNGYSKYSVFTLRDIVSKRCSMKKIQNACFNSLKTRYTILYNLFLVDTSKDVITIEDLKSLTGNITTEELYL